MIAKVYICHLVRVKDTEVEPLTHQSVPVVNEFLDVFPEDLPGLPLEWEVEFGIDVNQAHNLSLFPHIEWLQQNCVN